MNMAQTICFELNKRLVLRRDLAVRQSQRRAPEVIAGGNPAVFDKNHYAQWRNSELVSQFDAHFSPDSLRGKRVLDFGCGDGSLSFYTASLGAASVHGVDVIESNIRFAQSRAAESELPVPPTFSLSSTNRLQFPDGSFDTMLCFDVVEHIMDPLPIWKEWYRVLAPGGHMLIWWQPYYHPYGHHLMSYIPQPWAHVFFSRETLAATCNRIFHLPEYLPRYWDLDQDGNKLPDREFKPANLGGVNGLTISKFESQIKSAGFEFARREPYPMQGPSPIPAISKIGGKFPFFREYLTAYMIYDLVKPT